MKLSQKQRWEGWQRTNKGEASDFSALMKPEQPCFSLFYILGFYAIFGLKEQSLITSPPDFFLVPSSSPNSVLVSTDERCYPGFSLIYNFMLSIRVFSKVHSLKLYLVLIEKMGRATMWTNRPHKVFTAGLLSASILLCVLSRVTWFPLSPPFLHAFPLPSQKALFRMTNISTSSTFSLSAISPFGLSAIF